MKIREPKVKERANFCGPTVINGRPTVNARRKNNADSTRSAQKTCDGRYDTPSILLLESYEMIML